MALTADQTAFRENRVTASFLPALMAGHEGRILNEWRRLIKDPAYEPEDFSDNWPVIRGTALELPMLDLFQRRTGNELVRRGESVPHPDLPHVGCTLDAYRPSNDTVIDCKVIGKWRRLDEALPYYAPQMICQRACVGAERASLLVDHGGNDPEEYPVEWPPEYEAEVWARVDEFWRCVEALVPPIAMAPVAPPVPPEQWRTVDLTAPDGPNWAASMIQELDLWKATVGYARSNAKATKAIKDILPDDVGQVTWTGTKVSRSKNGAVTIREDDR